MLDKRLVIDEELFHKLGVQCTVNVASKYIIIKWIKPRLNRWKMNLDRCSKGNPSPSGCGSLLKSSSGRVEWAQAKWLGHQSNMQAKVYALLFGIRRCHREQKFNVDFEMDSQVLVDIITGQSERSVVNCLRD